MPVFALICGLCLTTLFDEFLPDYKTYLIVITTVPISLFVITLYLDRKFADSIHEYNLTKLPLSQKQLLMAAYLTSFFAAYCICLGGSRLVLVGFKMKSTSLTGLNFTIIELFIFGILFIVSLCFQIKRNKAWVAKVVDRVDYGISEKIN
jgi:hypothetical protein